MKKLLPHIRLERILDALSEETATASDEELLQACAELRIKPEMKGSLVWLGLKGVFFCPYVESKLAPTTEGIPFADPEDGDFQDTPRRH